ncbi:porin [Amphritea atlantica]|uniref:Porin n=1 Tax=Amphritea atlantica TaxID=355243 RepID=A0A1H9D1N6_9GAMM|nr:porin [Amphritea atlantica]SEQ07390.1 porin [Amphritea atlantica]
MKKSIIALAVAGALTAPMVAQADATLYGSLRVQIADADGSDLDIQDNTSRIGIKATSELFSGATAIAHFETYANTESGSFGTPNKGRLAYVGATGDFGTVLVGRQWLPAYLWTVGKTDIMAAANTETTHSYGTGGRQGNAAAYISPDLSGLQLAVAAVARKAPGVDAGGDTGADVDATHLAATYSVAGFGVALSTLQYKGTVDENINSLGLSYSAGDAYVALSVEDDEVNRNGADNVIILAGSYALGNTKLLASITDFGDDASNVDGGKRYIAEVQQKLGKQAFVFANYIEANGKAEDATNAVDTFAVGYNVSF